MTLHAYVLGSYQQVVDGPGRTDLMIEPNVSVSHDPSLFQQSNTGVSTRDRIQVAKRNHR
jgi:hypothetical protein